MKNENFVSELHDIGKLADRQALKKAGLEISGHTFFDFDFTLLNNGSRRSKNKGAGKVTIEISK